MITIPTAFFLFLLILISIAGIVIGIALAPLIAVIAMKQDPWELPDFNEDDGLPDDVLKSKVSSVAEIPQMEGTRESLDKLTIK